MAQVSISFGQIQIGVEDEDESARKLTSLAVRTIATLVAEFGAPETDEDEFDPEDDEPAPAPGLVAMVKSVREARSDG